MKTITILSLLSVSTLIACGATQERTNNVAAGAACHEISQDNPTLQGFYKPGAISKAEPVKKKQVLARAIQPVRTVGASMYVPAKPGMTPEYMERVLSCHAASGTALHPNDPLHPTSGSIAELSVRSSGPGLRVEVIGDGPATGREIWSRASALSRPGSQVEVEQVSQAPKGSTNL